MKKVYKMNTLECANCAAKMEDAIKKLDGVEDASVSFMLQKLTLIADEARIPEIIEAAAKICRKIEPDCEIVVK